MQKKLFIFVFFMAQTEFKLSNVECKKYNGGVYIYKKIVSHIVEVYKKQC